MRKTILFLLYFMLFSSFMGAQIFTISLSSYQLSLSRIALLLLIFMFVIFSFCYEGKSVTAFPEGENKYSIIFFIAWLFYSGLSLFWVKDIQLWFKAMYFIFSGILSIYFFSMFINDKKQIIKAFYVMEIMIIIHNIVGWYEIFTRNYHFISSFNEAYYASYVNRIPISFAGNPNDYAMIMTFGVAISYVCYKNNQKAIFRLLFSFTLISSIILLFMTQSRGLIIGFIMGLMFFIIFGLKSKNSIKKALFTLVTLFLIYILLSNSFITEYLSSFFIFDFTGADANRIGLTKNGIDFFISTLGFGTGAGNIEYWMQNYAIYPTSGALDMHNWWLELLSGYGFIIFVLYIIFYIKLFSSIFRIYKYSANIEMERISLGIMFCMIAFIVGSISSSSNINREWLWLFWGVAVAFQGLGNNYKKNKYIQNKSSYIKRGNQ